MLFLFPLDVLDEIWDVIESISEVFLTYSYSRNSVEVDENDTLFQQAVDMLNLLILFRYLRLVFSEKL